ncbi:hypothetical protein BO82DRAFT_402103 [Aspergillus uvarum CBS 121591]|uniref:Protein FAM118B n=1 Tax=Aspergillus uvarum CBS 121591 TaxID=1448315 RepID=A0A319CEV2_9EURO|nr:hypothetical protein BO82DRAFT_402103 [Aspergillus uvarum CBS 121591]PYH81887.1 hypothetical protein BO82DRAFT_402103 [Aspergillus uvarum CBS 121591]
MTSLLDEIIASLQSQPEPPTGQIQTMYVEKIRSAFPHGADTKGHLTILVGAGASIGAVQASELTSVSESDKQKTLSGLSWAGLLHDGLLYLKENHERSFDAYEQAELHMYTKILERVLGGAPASIGTLLRAAAFLKAKLTDRGKLVEWLDTRFAKLYDKWVGDRPNRLLDAIRELSDTGARIMTTNYDDLLSRHCHAQSIVAAQAGEMQRFFQRSDEKKRILHIHGLWSEPAGAVLDGVDYSRVIQDDRLKSFLQACFTSDEVVLFLGTGSGLNDPNLGRLLDWASDMLHPGPNGHFILLRDEEENERLFLNDLRYGPEYGSLPPFLGTLKREKSQNQSTAIPWQFPEVFPFNKRRFVPREALQTQIEEQLNVMNEPRVCALQGMGGIGKTEMARNVALAFKDKCHVFWIDCRTRTGMDEDFLAIGPALNLGTGFCDFRNIKNTIASRDDWIMIMDNVDDNETLIHLQMNMIPSPVRGRILLTGRVTTIGNVKDAPALRFPIMSATEAEALLRKLMLSSPVSEQEAHKLVEVLKYLPLAIEQAGCYIRATGRSIQNYMKLYEDEGMKPVLLACRVADPNVLPILSTFAMSYQSLSSDAQMLLKVLALIGPGGVSDDFLQRSADTHPLESSLASYLIHDHPDTPLPQDLSSLLSKSHRREVAIDSLVEVALLQRVDTRLIMHPMQLEWLKATYLEPARDSISLLVLAMVANFFASMTDREFVLRSSYVYYARTCIEILSKSYTNALDEVTLARLCFYLGRVFWLVRDDVAAAYLYERALAGSLASLQQPHILTFWTRKNLGLIYMEHGFFKSAYEQLKDASSLLPGSFERDPLPEAILVSNAGRVARDKVRSSPHGKIPAADSFLASFHTESQATAYKLLMSSIDKNVEQAMARNMLWATEPSSLPISRTYDSGCRFCHGDETRLLDRVKRMFRDSERLNLERSLCAVEVHLQAIYRILLGDAFGAASLCHRAASSDWKRNAAHTIPSYSWAQRMLFKVATCGVHTRVFETYGGTVSPASAKLSEVLLECRMRKDPFVGGFVTHSWNGLIEPASTKGLAALLDEFIHRGTFLGELTPLWSHCQWSSSSFRTGLAPVADYESEEAIAASYFYMIFILAYLLVGQSHRALEIFCEKIFEPQQTAEVCENRQSLVDKLQNVRQVEKV